MVKLRKASCYRRPKNLPYTRKSKLREKSYVRGAPYPKITTFDIGNLSGKFEYVVQLISKDRANIRHNALESARIAVNKVLETRLGLSNYHMKIRPYPHHVIRENPQAAGAGADRFSQGMAHSFGKPIGLAAVVSPGQIIIEVFTNKKNIEVAKEAVNQARYKFPIRGRIIVEGPLA
jgi:large subunit ribosomal protein L10e